MDAKDLRIVFMGTPEFAVPSLRALVGGGYNVVGVVTSPDKPAGRGQKIHRSEVKIAALELGLPVLQPEKLKAPEFVEALEALRPDLGIVIAFRMLPEVVWAMPRLGTFNLHASLLPQYRGAAPINWAIINGETETGVTTFLLNHEIDKGGTLRLGAYPCVIRPGTTMERCYGTLEISERHRHRYEFNNDYREALTSAGLVLSGLSPDGRLVETVELADQPFFVGVQYHPEFKSRPNHAHPLFKGFVQAALERENT